MLIIDYDMIYNADDCHSEYELSGGMKFENTWDAHTDSCMNILMPQPLYMEFDLCWFR